jgi:hypothetical protein
VAVARRAIHHGGKYPSRLDQSSPSRLENSRHFSRENVESFAQATQNPTHAELRRRPQKIALA